MKWITDECEATYNAEIFSMLVLEEDSDLGSAAFCILAYHKNEDKSPVVLFKHEDRRIVENYYERLHEYLGSF